MATNTDATRLDASQEEQRPLLTYSSILILAYTLLGVTFTYGLNGPVGRIGLLYSVFGALAWFGLGMVSRRRAKEQQQAAAQQAVEQIESRFEAQIAREKSQ